MVFSSVLGHSSAEECLAVCKSLQLMKNTHNIIDNASGCCVNIYKTMLLIAFDDYCKATLSPPL